MSRSIGLSRLTCLPAGSLGIAADAPNETKSKNCTWVLFRIRTIFAGAVLASANRNPLWRCLAFVERSAAGGSKDTPAGFSVEPWRPDRLRIVGSTYDDLRMQSHPVAQMVGNKLPDHLGRPLLKTCWPWNAREGVDGLMAPETDGSTSLTTTENERLVALEEKIERNLSSFIEAGNALLEIRDGRLYRQQHKTFGSYCLDKWGFNDRRASQLILAASVATDLRDKVDSAKRCEDGVKVSTIVETPKNEGQARELGKAPKEKRKEAWEKAKAAAPKDKKTGKSKVTAKHVKKAVEEITGKKPAPKKKKPPAPPAPDPVKPPEPEAELPEIDELEAALADESAVDDPSQPWAAYNRTIDNIINLLEQAHDQLISLTKVQGVALAFAGWIEPKPYRRLFDNMKVTIEKKKVTNWTSQSAILPDGRNFLYASDLEAQPRKKRK